MGNLKTKIIYFILAIGVILIAIFARGLYPPPAAQQPNILNENKKTEVSSDRLEVVSIKPDLTKSRVILPNQALEINFNLPLANDPNAVIIKPQTEIKKEVINNGKTLKITPENQYEFGVEYTLRLKKDYNLEGAKKLDRDIEIKFETIKYQGV